MLLKKGSFGMHGEPDHVDPRPETGAQKHLELDGPV